MDILSTKHIKMNATRARLCMIFVAVLWSTGGLFAKLIPWSGITITGVRGLIAAIFLGLYRKSFKPEFSKRTVITALMLTMTTFLFMVANKHTTAANAIVLQYTAPVFIIIYSYVFLKKKPALIDIGAVAFTLAGIVLFFIDNMGAGKLLGDFCALLSGVTFGAVVFGNSLPEADPLSATFLGNLFSVVFIPYIFFDKAFVAFELMPWIGIILMGIFQLGLAYLLFSLSVPYLPPLTSSIITSIEPVLNPILVFLVIGEIPGAYALAGGIIVILTIFIYNLMQTKKYNNQ